MFSFFKSHGLDSWWLLIIVFPLNTLRKLKYSNTHKTTNGWSNRNLNLPVLKTKLFMCCISTFFTPLYSDTQLRVIRFFLNAKGYKQLLKAITFTSKALDFVIMQKTVPIIHGLVFAIFGAQVAVHFLNISHEFRCRITKLWKIYLTPANKICTPPPNHYLGSRTKIYMYSKEKNVVTSSISIEIKFI